MKCMALQSIGGFLQRNPDIIEDPIRDFLSGTKIKLPSKNAIEKMK